MIKDKIEEMSKIQTGYGNYGFGLGQMIREHAGIQTGEQIDTPKQENLQSHTDTEEKFTMPPNSIAKKNGIWDENGLRQISGWKDEFKSKTLQDVIQSLNDFHREMGSQITLSNLKDTIDNGERAYTKLLEQVSHYVNRGRKWYAGVHIHRKEEKAMLPVMGTLLIKLYSMGNAFDYIENLSYDYLMKHGLQSAALGEIISGREALSTQGNMASTQLQEGQIDRTAYQMKKRTSDNKQVTFDKRQELMHRKLPVLQGNSKAELDGYLQELEAIGTMVEDLELQSSSGLEREDVKIDFIDITKMVHILSKNPALLTGEEFGKNERKFRNTDLVLAKDYYNLTKGMTVAEAMKAINTQRIENAEVAAEDSKKSGGVLSQVLIDLQKKRVLRTSKEENGVEQQKGKNNFNYDEAMSRLAEVTGLGGQAGARTTYYMDTEKKLQYGTNMEKAEGQQASKVQFSFGNENVDKNMRNVGYNIFGHESKEVLNKNAGLIISSFRLQILDYIAYHRDRHTENFFIDLDAADSTQAFMGIDNDNVFGKGTSSEKEKRVVSYQEHAKRGYEGTIIDGRNVGYKDVTSTLSGFVCIPKEIYKQIMELKETTIEEEMKPYLDRAARFALLGRIRSLKEYVSTKAKTVDLYTVEGMKEFKKETMGAMVKTIMNVRNDSNLMGDSGMYNNSRYAPGILMRVLMSQYFNKGSLIKDEKRPGEYEYNSNFEYIKEGQTPEEYFNSKNNANRNQDYWRVLDAMIEESGQTRSQVWENYMRDTFGDKRKEVENGSAFQDYKKAFLAGRMKMFMVWKQQEM